VGGKGKKLRRWIWLMYFLYKDEYRVFKPVKNHHKKDIKVERRKIEGMNQFRISYIYMEIS
jgi:hypothetical protein